MAATLSLPEVYLVVARHEIQFAREQMQASEGRYLAMAAANSADNFPLYSEMMADYAAVIDPESAKPQRATTQHLRGLFGALGIPTE